MAHSRQGHRRAFAQIGDELHSLKRKCFEKGRPRLYFACTGVKYSQGASQSSFVLILPQNKIKDLLKSSVVAMLHAPFGSSGCCFSFGTFSLFC